MYFDYLDQSMEKMKQFDIECDKNYEDKLREIKNDFERMINDQCFFVKVQNCNSKVQIGQIFELIFTKPNMTKF